MSRQIPERYPPVKNISDERRIAAVKEIFSTITGRYDFLNHLLSFRRDVVWRKFAVKRMKFAGTLSLIHI